MIHDVDAAIRGIITDEVIGAQSGVEVDFEAPTAEWATRRNAPTINVYLYDVTEDPKRRQLTPETRRDAGGIVQERLLPPRRYQLAYLVTAWTQRPEDEHRLLSALLEVFLRHPVLAPERLSDGLRAADVVIPVTIALPRPEARRTFDIWSSLGGELKASLDLVVVAPLTPALVHGDVAPPVLEDPRFQWQGDDLGPTRAATRRSPGRRTEGTAREVVYGGGGTGSEAGFGDGRRGRALVLRDDPEAARLAAPAPEGDGDDD